MSLMNLARRAAFTSQIFSRCVASTYIQSFRLKSSDSSPPKHSPEDVKQKLMQFFDNPKNYGENEVKHGRSWELPELRIKSNQDLHKLWYVLLKEKNMLLTMEEQAVVEHRLFPSPERLDKVNTSMSNLETVVRERNRAYFELETGTTGERPSRLVHNELGIRFNYRYTEHHIPAFINTKWQKTHKFGYGGYAVRKFLLKFREQKWNEKRKANVRDRNEVTHLLKRNPDLNMQTLRQKYPNVDIGKLVKNDRFRGHYAPKV